MTVRKLRLQRAWSQEQLAQLSGLSVRTIQRIEKGEKAGLETLKSLAAVFEIDISELQQENKIKTDVDFLDEKKFIKQKNMYGAFKVIFFSQLIILSFAYLLSDRNLIFLYAALFTLLILLAGRLVHRQQSRNLNHRVQ